MRLLDLTHPDDHRRATAAAIEVFKGSESVGLETGVRAKDGSWHWLRSSSALAPDDGLVYTRSTDVTELRLIAGECEELLEEVESLARSDALTGLPNRRALDEQLPREMGRARRAESPLSLAIVDIDRFKAYNPHPRPRRPARVRRRLGLGAARGKTRSSASAARSSSSSSPTVRSSRPPRSSSACGRRPAVRHAQPASLVGTLPSRSTAFCAGPTLLCTRRRTGAATASSTPPSAVAG